MERTGERRDHTDGRAPFRQPLLQAESAQAPLRACLLSGGASRRMGTDKALLPHPAGGSWLEHTLGLLLELDIPVTLLSRHAAHLQLARSLQVGPVAGAEPPARSGAPPLLRAITEPEPWQGPLLALHRLMQRHPDERLLLCPVDMPWLTPQVLRNLLQAAAEQPGLIHLAHDGERRQPLLGVYPSGAERREDLSGAILRGERRLQSWLAGQACREVRLDRLALRNVNRPEQLGADPDRGPATGETPRPRGHARP